MKEDRPPSRQVATLFNFNTQYSSDSVEWCPNEPHQNFFVCANYQIKESDVENNPCQRFGRILLFSMDPEEGFKVRHILKTAAVLDQKWCHNKIDGASILGVVNAQKTLEIYRLNSETLRLDLIASHKLQSDEPEILLLSLDWSTGKYESNEPEIVCSDSKGNIHRFIFRNNQLQLELSWLAHEFEAWIAAFYYWQPDVTFSGGDDSKFLKFDKRTGTDPVSVNKQHEAGVTAIHSNPRREFLLATGSYDERVRLWDIRCMKTATDSIEVPGPVWRVKWDPFRSSHLLTACMLGGVHVINHKTSNWEIVESYYEHKNIAYGADWCHISEVSSYSQELPGNCIIGSCSFYDHLLCVWKLKLDFN